MRQILIANNVAYSAAVADYLALTEGSIGIFKDGVFIPDDAVDEIDTPISIVLGRSALNGGPISINEIDTKSCKITKTVYKAAATYTGSVTIPVPVIGKDYTIVVMKKGIQFNERATWTVTTQAKENDTADIIAASLAKSINFNANNSGVTAVANATKIVITAVTKGLDYTITPSDFLYGVKVTDETTGTKAIGDKMYVQHLASEAAADRGFGSTYRDGDNVIPGYPIEVNADSYTIYTLSFANSRKSGTGVINHTVNQILTIAVPTGSTQIVSLDKIFALINK